jgi:hypothetical protein
MKIFDAEVIESTAVVDSEPIDIRQAGGSFGIQALLSGSSPNIKLEKLVGMSSDDTFREAVGSSDISAALTASASLNFDMTLHPWMKIRVTGNASNGANTVLTLRLAFDEVIVGGLM